MFFVSDLGRQGSDQILQLSQLLEDARFLLCIQLFCRKGFCDLLQRIRISRLKEHGILRRVHRFVFGDSEIHAIFSGFPLKLTDAGISDGHARYALILADQLLHRLFSMDPLHHLLSGDIVSVVQIHPDPGNNRLN